MVPEIQNIIRQALAEDLGPGDLTTTAIVQNGDRVRGTFTAKEDGVVAGWDVVRQVFAALDPEVRVTESIPDGRTVRNGDSIGTVEGKAGAILAGERTALNFFQRMSGIATLTRRFVDAVKGTNAVILDTRKTAPGLRVLDKMAVKTGGGANHRFGLFDMVLVKENHIAAAGGINEAVSRVRLNVKDPVKIEVEVRNLQELTETLELAVDRILLDNMDVEEMDRAVKMTGGRVPLEASGSVTLENVGRIAATGVQFISVGQLTHSVKALDISLIIERSS